MENRRYTKEELENDGFKLHCTETLMSKEINSSREIYIPTGKNDEGKILYKYSGRQQLPSDEARRAG